MGGKLLQDNHQHQRQQQQIFQYQKENMLPIGSSQMRSGRSSTIQTSSTGLMSSAKIGKKTLLGS
jgi:hypothetical protein